MSNQLRAISVAYVGSVGPDTPMFRTEAFSRAGNMFQSHLLSGLEAAGIDLSLVLSVQPLPSYPRSPILIVRSSSGNLEAGTPVSYIPFLNVSPIKQVLVGLNTMCRLLSWGWKRRHASRVVYTYNLSVPPAAFTLMAARLIRATVIASVNDINEPGETVPPGWPWKLDFWLHKQLLPRFDGLVVVSGAIIDDFAPYAANIRIEGGVVPKMITFSGGVHNSRKPGRFTIGFAGGLDAANGVGEMLRAIALLQGSRFRFLLAGIGPMTEDVRRAAALDPRIEYRGFLSLEDVLSLYAEADVLVNMRLTKTMRTRYFFPSKLLEFLASGTPVISTSPGHVEEEFGEFVYLLKDETPEGLAESVPRAEQAGKDARREMGTRARAFIVANKTWAAQTERVAHFIRAIAGRSATSPGESS
jgi:glycosyltransferase involved in cell wall biosynthesis